MTDKPILFSGSMIRALLDGRKTQTRRVLKPQPPQGAHSPFTWGTGPKPGYIVFQEMAGAPMHPWPYTPGDRLWVREAHYLTDDGESEYAVFAADEASVKEHFTDMQATMASHPSIDWSKHLRLRPSIHMPRWASRLTLIVTDVRVQRVQDITEGDAQAEGIERLKSGRGFYDPTKSKGAVHLGARFDWATDAFEVLWDSLNADRGFDWDANPWVSATTFTVHKCNIDQMEAA